MDATTTDAAQGQNPNNGKTITVCGRPYVVTVADRQDGKATGKSLFYILTGSRGARYGTLRNVKNPHLMFLVHAGRGFGPVRLGSSDTTWLTDEGGELREVRS